MKVTIRTISPRAAAVQPLIRALDAEMEALYPAESNHLDSVDELAQANVLFVGAFAGGELVGCGGVKIMPGGYGEIKRVYVAPRARGRGVGQRIMHTLEQHLMAEGVPLARLETGIHQPEALALYAKLGYGRIGPFGAYRPDPLSVFMEKHLPPRTKYE